jgi:hypothetical protein
MRMAVDIDQDLKELASQIDRLRVLYEQHFLGMEKLPPVVPRREAERLLALLGNQNIGNTALRFRYLNLVRRWKTHTERWDKVLREIENGTYRPHLVARERRERDRGPSIAREPLPAAASQPVPGMSETELRELHRRYVEACRSLGDQRDVRYDALVTSLQRQVPALLEKNRADALVFDVAVRGGKVILRAVPRRGDET